MIRDNTQAGVGTQHGAQVQIEPVKRRTVLFDYEYLLNIKLLIDQANLNRVAFKSSALKSSAASKIMMHFESSIRTVGAEIQTILKF